MTTVDDRPAAGRIETAAETEARAALAELIAKNNLPEPAAVRWHEFNFGSRSLGTLSLTAAEREHVTAWAEVLRRKVKTTQAIHLGYDPTQWFCMWDTQVSLKNWRPNTTLRVNHDESRHAKTAAAIEAERDELIKRVFDSALGGGAR